VTHTTCMTAPISRYTPTTDELAETAYRAVIDTMNESLTSGKHGDGSWNQGVESDPRWHLSRVARHAIQALMLLDGVDLKDQESVRIHTRNALARSCLALAQLGG
jgi:hypothetical protein